MEIGIFPSVRASEDMVASNGYPELFSGGFNLGLLLFQPTLRFSSAGFAGFAVAIAAPELATGRSLLGHRRGWGHFGTIGWTNGFKMEIAAIFGR